MKQEEDKRVEDIIDSLNGMHRASPGEHVFHRIEERVARSSRVLSFRLVSLAAACLLLLIITNVAMLTGEKAESAQEVSQGIETVINYYQLDENGISL